MGATRRTEYHWIDGRVVPVVRKRPTGKGRWPGATTSRGSLVVAIEESPRGIRATRGKAVTLDRLKESLSLQYGLAKSRQLRDIGPVPDSVIVAASGAAGDVVRSVVRQFGNLATEDRMTGHLFGSLDLDVELDGWRVKVSHQNFSPQTKESITGADVALIVDLYDAEGRRIIKAAWLQAKQRAGNPAGALESRGLRSQLANMSRHTQEYYAIIYSPEEVAVFRQGDSGQLTTLEKVIANMIRCAAGDPNEELVIDSLDRKLLVRVLLSEVGGES